VRARAAIAASLAGIERLRTEPPLALKPTADGVYLVGAAGGPVGGDDLALDVTVGAGAALTMRGVAATVALPGRPPAPSWWRLAASVGAGGMLDGRLAPTVLAAGCDHRVAVTADVAAGAALRWQEIVVRGRYGEPPGTGTAVLRVTVGGRPVVHHALSLHAASVGAARVVGMLAVVDPRWGEGAPDARSLAKRAWWLPADGPGGCVVALGDEVEEVEVVLADQCNQVDFRTDWAS
jgi:urease accessory protein